MLAHIQDISIKERAGVVAGRRRGGRSRYSEIEKHEDAENDEDTPCTRTADADTSTTTSNAPAAAAAAQHHVEQVIPDLKVDGCDEDMFANDESAEMHATSANSAEPNINSIVDNYSDYENDNDDDSVAIGIVQTRTPFTPCTARLRHECTNPMFDITEPNGKQIDIQRTFAPKPYWLSWILRLSFLCISLESLIATLSGTSQWNRWFFMAYLTHWGLCVAIAYQLSAVLCLLFRNRALYQPHQGERCSLLVRTTWGLFSLAAPVALIICILYWGLDYTPGNPVHYTIIMNHGGIALLLLVDGFVLSSYPLQLKQGVFTAVFCIAYLCWTVLFAESDIPNPNEEDGDDYIYHVLEWKADPRDAEILSSLCALVLPPVVFGTFWVISLSRRHVYETEDEDEQIELVGVNGHGILVGGVGHETTDHHQMATFTISDDDDAEII